MRKRIESTKRQYRTAREIAQTESKRAVDAKRKLDALEQAGVILREAAEQIQNSAHEKIADIVSQCLAVVFPQPYLMKIEFQQKRGKTEANLYFERNGMKIDPLRAAGHGVADVASFVLRVASIMQRRPKPRLLIVADEPFRNVSREYLPRVKFMLDMLSSNLGFQFIIVTHLKELNDVSSVTEKE